MRSRILRVALVVVAVAVQGGAGFFVLRAEQRAMAARDAQRTLGVDVGRLLVMLSELRGAQAGQVVSGQDPAFWGSRVTTLVQDAGAAMRAIDRSALAPEAAQELNVAAEAVAAFERAASRVRDLLAAGQPLTATEVAFGDAAQSLSVGTRALVNVPGLQASAVDRDAARVRPQEGYALAGAMGVMLIVLLLLAPRTLVPDIQLASEPEVSTGPGLGLGLAANTPQALDALGRTGFDLDLDRPPAPPPPQAAPESLPEPPRESEAQIVEDLQSESQLRLNSDLQVDLQEVARLCSDFARVKDAGELPQLLARAAELLDASGIVLWIGGVGGNLLHPALSHGYSDRTLEKMKALPDGGENAVSRAFRTGRMEVVAAAQGRNGAIVAPISSANGCVGAMAAEIRHGAEASASVQALAVIVAAQLATLVAEAAPA